jgi:hypothetical protein
MSKRKDRREFSLFKLPSVIKKKLFRNVWIESEDKVKLQRQQQMKIKIQMKLN